MDVEGAKITVHGCCKTTCAANKFAAWKKGEECD